MCKCQTINQFFVCPERFSDIFSNNYEMKARFSDYITEYTPCDEVCPEFDCAEFYYIYAACQQSWYFECYPSLP